MSASGNVILFAVKDVAGLRLYAHCGLRQQVSERDREYIDDLLIDLEHRSKEAPEQVFQQLTNLSVGPIVTQDVVWMRGKTARPRSIPSSFSFCGD